MRRIRIIPILLLQNGGLVKSIRFKDHKYVGDPINAVRIFNDKEVDEIVILDISASREKRPPAFDQIADIGGEAFMPFAYGGGIRTLEEIRQLLSAGAEKIVLNTAALDDPGLISTAAAQFGSQAVVVSIDVRKDWRGKYRVYRDNGQKKTKHDPATLARQLEAAGAGEIMLMSIDQDGTFDGYDLALTRSVSQAVSIPLIAAGGASSLADFREAIIQGGASAVAAGSMFVYQRPHRAVLISYPKQEELTQEVFSKI